jgi:hypothetical protein
MKPHNKPRQVANPEDRWAMDTMTRSEAAVRADHTEPVPVSKMQADTVKAVHGNHANTDFEGWEKFKDTPQIQGKLPQK